MAKVTLYLLCAFVFFLPLEMIGTLANLPSVGRLMGLATLFIGLFAVVAGGRVSRMPAAFVVMVVYSAWFAASLAWSVDSDTTLGASVTIVCLLVLVWLVLEFAPTLEDQVRLMRSYTYGLGVAILMQLALFRDVNAAEFGDQTRYTGGGQDPNYFSELLSIGAIFCAYLVLYAKHTKGRIPWQFLALLPLIAFSIMLTGSRTGFVALFCSGAFLLVILRSGGGGWKLIVVFLVLAAGAFFVIRRFAPEGLMTRVTQRTGLSAEDLGDRLKIWEAAGESIQHRPILGAGGRCCGQAIDEYYGKPMQTHNLFMTIAVELGLVGLSLFLLLLFLLFLAGWSMPKTQRMIWLSALLVWGLFAMFGGSAVDKMMWFMFSMILAQARMFKNRRKATAAVGGRILPRAGYARFTR